MTEQRRLSSEDYRLNKTAVALDFDHTLFDCDRLFRILSVRVTSQFLIPESAQDLWDEAALQKPDRNESSYEYFMALTAMRASQHCGRQIEVVEIREAMERAIRDTARGLLFEDAMPLLYNTTQQPDKDFYILTKGNRYFQDLKINASGVRKFIKPSELAAEPMRSRVLITTDSKGPYVYELSKYYQRVVFVDDKIEQLASVAEFMKHMGAADYPVIYGWIIRRPTSYGNIPSAISKLEFSANLHPWVLELCDR